MTKIAAREPIFIHTLDNIVEHYHSRPAKAFWQAGRDSIQGLHLALQEHGARNTYTPSPCFFRAIQSLQYQTPAKNLDEMIEIVQICHSMSARMCGQQCSMS